MPISIKVATTSEEKNLVFKLRHQVFVEEEKRFEHNADYIVDRFDTFDETINILALDNNVPVGTIRVVMGESTELPALEHFDFIPYMKKLNGKVAAVGWLGALQKYRRHPGLFMGLIKVMVGEMRKRGYRHVIAPLHPGVFPLLKRFGAEAIDNEFHSDELNVSMLPIHVDTDEFPSGIRETMQDPSHPVFGGSNERRIYKKDEVIIEQGGSGKEVYMVMRGAVRVLSSESNQKEYSCGRDSDHYYPGDILLGQGQIFGETSFWVNGARSATVIGYSKEVDVMVLYEKSFEKQIEAKYHEIFKILAARIRMKRNGASERKQKESLVARILKDASVEGEKSVSKKWLARQCGLWIEDMEQLVETWSAEGVITDSDLDNIIKINNEILKQKVIVC